MDAATAYSAVAVEEYVGEAQHTNQTNNRRSSVSFSHRRLCFLEQFHALR
jgi:hypothetical protein